jgi:putative transposase
MSRKMKQYSTQFKTKLVLEVLKGDRTLNEIASEYNVIPKNLQNWKRIFLENAEMAMEPARAVKEYKEEIKDLQAKNDEYAKTVGKLTVENNWMSGKLKSLDSKNKQAIVESKLDISVSSQCKLIGLNRTNLYYTPTIKDNKIAICKQIQSIYKDIPSYGYLKVHKQLLEDGFTVSSNTVQKYRQELGLRAVLAVRVPYTSKGNKQHPIYSYKLKSVDITRANQVWSTDITYIRIKGGFVYLAAIIDWYSKAVLSWRVSNTMDTDLVMSVLNEALSLYPKPEIFNTDQGSQYTSYIHTDTLKQHNITISMNGTGRSVDNICIERFWRSAKVEKIYLNEYKRVSVLKEDVKEYINFYNHKRFHENLEYKKPMEVYFNSMKINDKNCTLKLKSVA